MESQPVDLAELAELAERAARRAGEILNHFFGKVKMEFKGEIDLVTEADRASERAILEMVKERFPEHGICAEESGETRTNHTVRWIIDPLDGTTNYAHGLPVFAVSIAVEVAGRIEVGIVHNPPAGEMYVARRGHGATLNGRPIHVSETSSLNRSLLVTGFPYNIRDSEENNLDHFSYFSKRVQGLRRLGSAAMDLAYVARGSLDAYWEPNLNAWDIAAGWLLVEEAGGRVTDLRGRELTFSARQILASNGRIHEEMVRGLAEGKTGLG